MTLFIVSFLAGVLTILAPCILPLLPVVVGGSLGRDRDKGSLRRPLVITLSLALSIVLFTLLLKAGTLLLGVPTQVWQVVSGGIIVLFGLSLLFPKAWEEIMIASRLQARSNRLLAKTTGKRGMTGDILLGAALGPVFSSCSPTFALIVATVLPVSFGEGLVYLSAYAAGLAAALLVVVLAGQIVVKKLGFALNPEGWFSRIIGIIFVVVGALLIFGIDKKIQAYVLERGWYDPISGIEKTLRR
ncbi:cytochrome c biogenesis protein CcdA [Streptomyces caniscabiei]|uniref:cytochrome c biogenesis CcdA family protein n=1 Tax=Streptomyces caniscabiei TaxID=2746961 RepID=UPI0029AC3089|nr:cytochrome c biogenesis protein CcdA [Streptomyces caniscabiei]MDX2776067.1 cytochrome c biogenesis protein CcdA [Streptomyces caniscabiei]